MRRGMRGFTLVELLVALFAMALLAMLSWRGLDGMVRARQATQERADQVLTLQAGLAQWGADLDSVVQLPRTRAIDWNGRVLRMTRRGSASPADGISVVAWSRKVSNGVPTWSRWQSAPVTTRGDLETAWQRADQWSQNASTDDLQRQVAVTPLADWQIFFFRENAWTNPQSSDVTTSSIVTAPGAPIPADALLPDGVRLVITLPPGQAVSGTVVRDWVRPSLAGNKS